MTDEEIRAGIAEVVANWTGIPVARMVESERDKILRMPERLRERVDRAAREENALLDRRRRLLDVGGGEGGNPIQQRGRGAIVDRGARGGDARVGRTLDPGRGGSAGATARTRSARRGGAQTARLRGRRRWR